MKKKLHITLIVLIGFVAVYFIWPRTIDLPKLGTVNEPNLTEISGNEYHFPTDKPKLVTFFYTQCPDVCPMTIMDLTNLQEKLHEKGIEENDYDVILITLDPEVDTIDQIKQYKNQFDITSENWFFLRGTEEDTLEITEQFKMAFKKDSDGFIAHSTTMYLLDEENQIRAYHDMNIGKSSVNLEQLTENFLILLN